MEFKVPCAVKYKGRHFFCYKVVKGKARLLNPDGSKYSGTPGVQKLHVTKVDYEVTEYNGHEYAFTLLGPVSLSTGNVCPSISNHYWEI